MGDLGAALSPDRVVSSGLMYLPKYTSALASSPSNEIARASCARHAKKGASLRRKIALKFSWERAKTGRLDAFEEHADSALRDAQVRCDFVPIAARDVA